ncbi:conserved exported protein of unknown function [Candidatus Hydrogenisulfobacillus filiaventi]|uniref:Uncharacterized protein n=1 Tax=Candidatus Hydrogenisulfobacillus filiaventi TaxID=2707344 RepID=A0A6F8ZJH7_9FIRM|nr:hypothetical protein [Bacillota bacterium]CAB1129831.1 conserved exported protein of unknown function [Candidatus Hydrogenisulfobacillus filiaventi]
MRRLPRKTLKVLGPLALTVLLGGSAYAFMANNNVHQSSAGSGQGTITGYTVSGVTYNLSQYAPDPDHLTSVSFVLTPAPGGKPADQVAVWFNGNKSNVANSAGGECRMIGRPAPNGAENWTCSIGWDQQAQPSLQLDVAAAH